MRAQIVFLIDHPGLHLLLAPLMRALQDARRPVMALVCDHGVRDFLEQHALPYVTQFEELQLLAPRMEATTVFVSASDQQFSAHKRGREFVHLAKRHGFATVSIQHGPFCLLERQNPECVCEADLLFTFGRAEYDFFRALGMGKERLFIVGSPKYDEILKLKQAPRRKPPTDILLLGALHTLRAICGYSRQDCAEILHALSARILEANPECVLRLKPHPAESTPVFDLLPLYQEIVQRLPAGRAALVDATGSFYQHALDSKFVVSFSGSSIVEALLLGRPVLYINEYYHPRTNRMLALLEELHAVATVPSAAFLAPQNAAPLPELSVQRMQGRAEMLARTLRQANFMNDGNACARIVALLARLQRGQSIEAINGVPKLFCYE